MVLGCPWCWDVHGSGVSMVLGCPHAGVLMFWGVHSAGMPLGVSVESALKKALNDECYTLCTSESVCLHSGPLYLWAWKS